jgi:hypothetical protein
METTNIIRDVVEIVKNKKEVVARIGLRTNGDLHLGNIFPIISGFILGKKLKCKFKLVIVLVDLEYDKNNNIPFIYQKDECHKNLAEYSIDIIESFIEDLKKINNIEVEFHRVSNLLKEKKFRKIIYEYLSQGRHEFKIYPLCNNCKSINTNWSLFHNKIYFICKNCRLKQSQNIKDVEFAIDHDILGVIENQYFAINIHIIGRDHNIKNKKTGVSSLDERKIFADYLSNKTDFITLITPLVLFKDNKKMSKSNKKGIFLKDIQKKYKKSYYSRLYNFVNQTLNNNIEFIKYDLVKELFKA